VETRTKRLIFFSLVIVFSIYSILVYTSSTDYSQGQEFYTKDAASGKLVFQKYNCISCHQIYGLGGYMGPDLSQVMVAEGKGEAYVNAFLTAGTDKMPRFDLEDQEKADLIAYLRYVGKATQGMDDYKLTWYGTMKPKSHGE
jgi:nitric oxide reductase subunit C